MTVLKHFLLLTVLLSLLQCAQSHPHNVFCYFNSWFPFQIFCPAANEITQCYGPLPTIENGFVGEGSNKIGDQRTVHCNEGVERYGSDEITCQSNGQWSSVRMTCRRQRSQPRFCTSLPSVDNAFIWTGFFGAIWGNYWYHIGSTVVVICYPGYELIGPAKKECLPTGEWSNAETTCQKHGQQRTCGETLPEIANGWIDRGSNDVGSRRLVQCDLGYDRKGLEHIECQRTGQWSALETTCERSKSSVFPFK